MNATVTKKGTTLLMSKIEQKIFNLKVFFTKWSNLRKISGLEKADI